MSGNVPLTEREAWDRLYDLANAISFEGRTIEDGLARTGLYATEAKKALRRALAGIEARHPEAGNGGAS